MAEGQCTQSPGTPAGRGPEEEEDPSPEQEPALSCWSYLVRLQLFPNRLDGIPTLAEHGLKQALLGLLTLSLNKGRKHSVLMGGASQRFDSQ